MPAGRGHHIPIVADQQLRFHDVSALGGKALPPQSVKIGLGLAFRPASAQRGRPIARKGDACRAVPDRVAISVNGIVVTTLDFQQPAVQEQPGRPFRILMNEAIDHLSDVAKPAGSPEDLPRARKLLARRKRA